MKLTSEEVRRRIRLTRKEKQLTAAAVALAVGISRPFYTQLEGGTRRLSMDYFLRIAEALHTHPTRFLEDASKWPR
jgi:transcriptional regulator with XRE-family HTH domain